MPENPLMAGRHSTDLEDKLLRGAVRALACPACHATPGTRCIGVKDQRRNRSHDARWQAYRAHRASMATQEGLLESARTVELPSPTAASTSAARPTREDTLKVACLHCKAEPGSPCTGVTGKPRAASHLERWDAYKESLHPSALNPAPGTHPAPARTRRPL